MKYFEILKDSFGNWFDKMIDLLPNFAIGLIVFFVFYLFSQKISRFFTNMLIKTFPNHNQNNQFLLFGKIFKFLFLLLGVYISLEIMHLGSFLNKFLGSIGVAGIIAGVALKDLVANVFSGILINIEKSISIGDRVKISDINGVVLDISYLTVKIKAEDNTVVYVPNQLVFNSAYTNYSQSSKKWEFINFETKFSENLLVNLEKVKKEINDLPFLQNSSQIEILDCKNGICKGKFSFEIHQNEDENDIKNKVIFFFNQKLEVYKDVN